MEPLSPLKLSSVSQTPYSRKTAHASQRRPAIAGWRSALLLTALAWCAPLSADTPIYRWVDKSGTVHFSDEPGPGAQRIELPPPATISLPKPSSDPVPTERPQVKLIPGYQHLEITFPQPDSAFHAGDGSFTVTTRVEPPLVPSHELRLLLDGQIYASGGTGQFRLNNIDRGTHQLQLQVLSNGQVIQSSPVVTFTLHRPSVLHPNRRTKN